MVAETPSIVHIDTAIRRAQSCLLDAREAVREFHAAVVQPGMELVIFFCSSDYHLEDLADEMRIQFAGVQVVGCTTAGEIGPAGYLEQSLSGASFPSATFNVVSGSIEHLQEFAIATGQALAQQLLQRLEGRAPRLASNNSFALLLIDGLSMREEPVTRVLQSALGALPLIGGSAGDGVNLKNTYVFFDGCFHSDSAVLTLVSTPLPFKLVKTQHFVATDERLVVTETDTALRIVREINGLPAAQEYARMLGIDQSDLKPGLFAAWPLVVVIDGNTCVRSIQRANEDGSLTLACAIENGLVLRVARGVDLVENLEYAFSEIRAVIGEPQLFLGFDCLLRKLEINHRLLTDLVSEVLLRNRTVGFNTYGEQFHGVHVNQTLVGVAIGSGLAVTPHA